MKKKPENPFKGLTAKEKKHLRGIAGVTTLEQFKRTAEFQKQCRDAMHGFPFPVEPCWTCKAIARKLGLPV